eukprot:CAMPEP_0172516218 /NCGR_PEP_ID=MMETSP1066-20121228/274457_1 /TAXON_ID=671091 /ORGANISM="Coscinodiscus wailesii, Strain CCMP2513" /LENGTH=70 /DNA_ID=CAMNT_0013297603 /DNA_START=115 /DNA_END=324 /DNA_ORIENTATION=-
MVQACRHDMIAVGGGMIDDLNYTAKGEHLGFGLALNESLCQGTTSACATFDSPCLTNYNLMGDVFEVANL